MKPPLIILSAAYISETLHGHLGKIRTSLIPVGGSSLVELNCELFSEILEPYVAYHSSDLTTKSYLEIRSRNKIEINGDASLKEAVLQSIDNLLSVYKDDFSFQLLFGDTTIKPESSVDFISLILSRDDFSDWTSVSDFENELIFNTPAKKHELIVGGYFGFSSAKTLQKILLNSNSFYEAVSLFDSKVQKLERLVAQDWLDFGRVNTLYISRMNMLTSRSFNTVKADNSKNTIRKSSIDLEKIRNEINWYTSLPQWKMSHIAPNLTDFSLEQGWYETEYCLQPNMAEIFIFSRKSMGYWNRFFTALQSYFKELTDIASLESTQSNLDLIRETYLKKLDKRMKQLQKQSPEFFELKFKMGDNLIYLAEYIALLNKDMETFIPKPMTLIHGDFFFGNMFFWDELNRLVCIDPLGLPSEGAVFDLNYEFAKLSHSFFGGYDFLAANLFSCGSSNDVPFLEIPWQNIHHDIKIVASDFFTHSERFYGISRKQIRKLEAFLFLTLSPLHPENRDRQLASIIRSIQVYTEE